MRSPKVLTATEIKRKTGVSYNTALLLKRRIQLFASEQKESFRDLIYEKLESSFQEFRLPDSNGKGAVSEKNRIQSRRAEKVLKKAFKGKSQVNADTLVLFSASQRANKGRRRHKHGGCTASIYMSAKLGGKQIGTLVHTIATSEGALILDSVPDQKMNTLGPLFLQNIPKIAPVFTDSAYPWLSSVYRNHRMVNHSAKSKDSRYRWARNRWNKDGVHIQYAEGNHRVIKQAFSEYGYIRPEYSQLYLNEYCFFKNFKAFGMEKLVDQNSVRNEGSKKGSAVVEVAKTRQMKNSIYESLLFAGKANFQSNVRKVNKK
ncbi:transposase [Leptospira alexanderi]|uniref:ISXO2-like transposase domain protein n=1 Tax=Leptospira alexanderi serovar Manhao 3 str. L 60 TaxID=1049759 RepID=V6I109_9LEPT|nr:transposase [Leptospira alexanderi]EQA63466.1 ISXO2-like transposase domain protein [Leptospira alexanderi serovar Manhao 3 str. L 60]